MKIVVTGGAGFLGSRLIDSLLEARASGASGLPAFDRILSVDLAACPVEDERVSSLVGDISDRSFVDRAIGDDTVAVCHLAAVVSGQAEAEFDTGMRVNLHATLNLLEACRAAANRPRFVFSSSLAVFGGELPATVPEAQALLPRSSYGAQKAMGELLVADYSRKGFIDGLSVRLPTVVVRPGRPNAAASSFASGIIREPLAGEASNCPVPLETRLWLTSPDTAVANLLHALTLSRDAMAAAPVINLPGISVSVAEMLDSLKRVGGEAAHARVSTEHDPAIAAIVCSWPGDFDIARPLAMGFARDGDFDGVVRQHMTAFPPAG